MSAAGDDNTVERPDLGSLAWHHTAVERVRTAMTDHRPP